MTKAFASGKYSHGYCERCGFRAPLKLLKTETVRGRALNNRVCPSCYDSDHPQNFLGDVRVEDPQALRRAATDTGLAASRFIPPPPPPPPVITYFLLTEMYAALLSEDGSRLLLENA